MLRLQLYILRRLAANLLLVVLVVGTILFVGQTVQFLQRLHDVGLEFLLGVLPLFLPVTLALTLPLAFLVATVLTYGRLSEDNEVLGARMAGIHPWVLVAPGIFAGAVVSLLCLDLWGNRVPAALAAQDGIRGDVYRLFVEIVERGEKSSFSNGDFRISWSGVEDGELVDLRISKGGAAPAPGPGKGGSRRPPGAADAPPGREIYARRARIQRDATGGTLIFHLRDALTVTDQEGGYRTARFEDWNYAVDASDLLAVKGSVARSRSLLYGNLLFLLFRLPESDRRLEILREICGRISFALSPLGFALCGIPLALLVGKGSRAGAAVLALGVALLYFVLWQAGNSLAVSHRAPALPAMLAGNAVLFALGGWLLRRVVRR